MSTDYEFACVSYCVGQLAGLASRVREAGPAVTAAELEFLAVQLAKAFSVNHPAVLALIERLEHAKKGQGT